jgi:hypothetical protein
MRLIRIAAVVGVFVSPLTPIAADELSVQVAQAVSPLPDTLRDGATVVTYDTQGNAKVLRQGTNAIVCQTNQPTPTAAFAVSCYHQSMKATRDFQAKLRAEGKDAKAIAAEVDEARASGKLSAPAFGTMLYSRSGKSEQDARTLWVMLAPNATAEATGLPTERPKTGGPWLMNAGKPSAHVMIPVAPAMTGTPSSDKK